MNQPSELSMLRTRLILSESRGAYLEAIASHHSRVAQIACDMRKIIELQRYSENPTAIDGALNRMAQEIERSFADAFGVELASAQKAETSER